VNLEKFSDDLWVGVKGQSNLVIAGSLRNVFRCSVNSKTRGRALNRQGAASLLPNLIKLRILATILAVRLRGIISVVKRERTQNIS